MALKVRQCAPLGWFMSVVAGIAIAPAAADAQATETVLHSFRSVAPKGGNPQSRLLRDASGNLYGTAFEGPSNMGVIYKLDPAGHQTVLYGFTGGADGGSPNSALIGDGTGNLYGTAASGGVGGGVVYKLDSTGHEMALYSFTGGTDGGTPVGGVVRDAAGNLYGTTTSGGSGNGGVVFKVDPAGQETVLYAFPSGSGLPSGVILDPAGNLYGTVGSSVYMLDPSGQEKTLYNFAHEYVSPLIRDSAGNLYGTDSYLSEFDVFKIDPSGKVTDIFFETGAVVSLNGLVPGASGDLYGIFANEIFKMDSAGHKTALYIFKDGTQPDSLILDAAGIFYGTIFDGGPGNLGSVFKLDATGHETVLYSFPRGRDGYYPATNLIGDAAGNLYGTTYDGGTANAGVVYKLDSAGRETILYTFTGGKNGGNPNSGLILDSSGNFYGTFYYGGASNAGGVYKLDPTGHQTVLYSFTGGADGKGPGGVIRDRAGNLYGTTAYGGTVNSNCSAGCGLVYKINASGQETVLYRFTGGADGASPTSGLTPDSSGNLYGTTFDGGPVHAGVVYKIDPAGQETVLYSFKDTPQDGTFPIGDLFRDAAGNLYGSEAGAESSSTPCGLIYKLDTKGNLTVLYNFLMETGGSGGCQASSLIGDAAGNLYGTTGYDGAGFAGVVFKLDAAGNYTVLYSFTGGADGRSPAAGLMRDSAGNLYGTTYYGGQETNGTVFKVKPE